MLFPKVSLLNLVLAKSFESQVLRTIFRNLFEDTEITTKFPKNTFVTHPLLKLMRLLFSTIKNWEVRRTTGKK